MRRHVLAALAILVVSTAPHAVRAQAPVKHFDRAASASRNPKRLDAVEVLVQAAARGNSRVRFEWDQVPGATEYILTGKWTTPPSWTIRSAEHRVTSRVATHWDAEKVAFEITLPAGSHSWAIVALFGAPTTGDFENPAVRSFDLK